MSLIDHIDHIVVTCVDPEATKHFYTQVLKMKLETFGAGRIAFRFGNQKINLHVRGSEYEPKAHIPAPGALDLCFIATVPLDDVIAHLKQMSWPIIEGPVEKTGATQKIRSVYVRDPDLNLIEISELMK
jgi:catechol 2,3-dioxygenase-like lactoylglutathione lyase family enzyme